jgi:hypothetical protein
MPQVPPRIAGRDHGARAYDRDVFILEGHTLRIIEQSETDAGASTSLYVPSIDLVVGGDVFCDQCHMMVAVSTPECRVNWIADLGSIEASKRYPDWASHQKWPMFSLR